ncbi:MAG: DnaJ domain-containing protein [Clostridiales bacterium]|jgi:molecular chaperone DnaJ|nr:DnaJ domain-containing protein [Clostridiales bacterium]
MADPYKVLGVSPSAAESEIAAAYRKLAKKYHPDVNPGDKTAEAKMREVNAAHEQIKMIKNGKSVYGQTDGYGTSPGGGYAYGGYGPFEGFDFEDIFGTIFGSYGPRYNHEPIGQARWYIQTRQYQRALHILSQIPGRNAEWHYLSAIANAAAGSRITALNHAKDAVRMDPGNSEYQRLLDQLQQGSYAYRQTGRNQGFGMREAGRGLLQFALAQILCLFCCRGC